MISLSLSESLKPYFKFQMWTLALTTLLYNLHWSKVEVRTLPQACDDSTQFKADIFWSSFKTVESFISLFCRWSSHHFEN